MNAKNKKNTMSNQSLHQTNKFSTKTTPDSSNAHLKHEQTLIHHPFSCQNRDSIEENSPIVLEKPSAVETYATPLPK